jgi:hypothetical protein
MVTRKVSVGCGAAMLDHPAVVGFCGCDFSLFGAALSVHNSIMLEVACGLF